MLYAWNMHATVVVQRASLFNGLMSNSIAMTTLDGYGALYTKSRANNSNIEYFISWSEWAMAEPKNGSQIRQ